MRPEGYRVAVRTIARRFDVEDVRRMRDTGILGDEERVELVDGIVIPMSPEGPRHRGAVAKVASVLGLAYGPDASVWTQSMFLLAGDSFRVPDLVIVTREIWAEAPDSADVARRCPGRRRTSTAIRG